MSATRQQRWMAWGLVALGAALLAPSDALGGPVPCGDVTYIGECVGDTARYCAGADGLIEVDCSVQYGANSTCGLLDCTDPATCEGYYCVARAGTACALDVIWCDAAQGLGCRNNVCTASQACDPQVFNNSCTGNVVTFCFDPVVWDYDCSGGGADPYTCGTNSAGDTLCLGLAGAECDESLGFECVSGLACVNLVCVGTDAGAVDTNRPDTNRADTNRADTNRADTWRPDTNTTIDRGLGTDLASGSDRAAGSDLATPDRDLASDRGASGADTSSIGPASDGGPGGGEGEDNDYVSTAGCACEATAAPVAGLGTALLLCWRLGRRRSRRRSSSS